MPSGADGSPLVGFEGAAAAYRKLLVAVVLAVLCAFGATAWAQEPAAVQAFKPDEQGLAIKVSPLADGLARANRWTAVRITVLNVGDPTTATLSLAETMPDGTTPLVYSRSIDLPKGTRKDVVLPFRPGHSLGTRGLRLETDDGRSLLAPYRLQMVAEGDVSVGVIGDDALGATAVTTAWGGPVPGKTVRAGAMERKVRVGLVPTASMPDRSFAYGSLDWMVWHSPDPADLTADQMLALRAWVADGGHLLVTMTDTYGKVAGTPLGEMLPVEVSGIADAPSIDPLLLAVNGASYGPATTPVATATVREVPGRDTWVWSTLEDGRPAWVTGTYGLGTVHVVTADPTLVPFSTVDREAMWRRLLWLAPPLATPGWFRLYPGYDPGTDYTFVMSDYNTGGTKFTAVDQWSYYDPPIQPRFAEAMGFSASTAMDTYLNDANTEWGTIWSWENDLRSHLSDIPGVAPLPLSWLLIFAVLYLFAIGPFDYFVLRLIGRQPLTWITFPIYIVLFSTLALVGTSVRKGSQAAVVRVELVDVLPGTDLWRGETFLGVFATRKTELEVRGGFDDAVVMPLNRETGAMWDPHILSDEGGGGIGWRAETWTLAYAKSSWTAPQAGTVAVKRIPDGFELTSTLPIDLIESDIYVRNQRFPTGPLKAGETKQVHLSTALESYYAPPLGTSEVDLRKVNPVALQEWGSRQFMARPAMDRGLMDPGWALPTLLGIATTPVEPLQLSGLEPETRTVVYLRVPIPAKEAEGLGGAATTVGFGAYVYSPPPPGAPTYKPGSVLRITALGPTDYNLSDQAKLIGQICTVTYDATPYDAQYYSGTMTCGDASSRYFTQVRFDVISQPPAPPTEPVYPNGSVLEITGLHSSDSNAYDTSIVGKRCTASGDVIPADATYFVGAMQCTDGTYYYFNKVAVKVISLPPPPIRSASVVRIDEVDSTDGYFYDRMRLVGQTCSASGDMFPIDSKWTYGGVTCADGGYYYFSKAAFTVITAAPEPIKNGTAVTILDIDPYDGLAYDKARLIGLKCAASGDLYAADATYQTGSLYCSDGGTYWFYKVKVDTGKVVEAVVPVPGEPVTVEGVPVELELEGGAP